MLPFFGTFWAWLVSGLWLNLRCVSTDLTIPITSKLGCKHKSRWGINKTRSCSPRQHTANVPGNSQLISSPRTPTGRKKSHFGSKALIKYKWQNTHFRINSFLGWFGVFFFGPILQISVMRLLLWRKRKRMHVLRYNLLLPKSLVYLVVSTLPLAPNLLIPCKHYSNKTL